MTTGEIQFETPENIRVTYRATGPGTRFVAWFVDYLLLVFCLALLVIPALIIFIVAVDAVMTDLTREGEFGEEHPALFALGIFWLVMSFGSFFYFGISELFFRGQTLGKRLMGIRVVKSDGFALDSQCILIRTLFRVVDHLPPLWLVPVFSARSQRLGDLVAGTVVVTDEKADFGGISELAERKYADCRYHFDVTALSKARRQDIEAVEQVLRRFGSLNRNDRDSLVERLVTALAARMMVDAPPPADRGQFLEDFLSAEYRRQYRKLG